MKTLLLICAACVPACHAPTACAPRSGDSESAVIASCGTPLLDQSHEGEGGRYRELTYADTIVSLHEGYVLSASPK